MQRGGAKPGTKRASRDFSISVDCRAHLPIGGLRGIGRGAN